MAFHPPLKHRFASTTYEPLVDFALFIQCVRAMRPFFFHIELLEFREPPPDLKRICVSLTLSVHPHTYIHTYTLEGSPCRDVGLTDYKVACTGLVWVGCWWRGNKPPFLFAAWLIKSTMREKERKERKWIGR